MHVDLDQDNMPDKWEEENGLNPLVDDSFLDPDSDGLTNLEEYQNNTDPLDSDTDNDSLIDGDEVNTYFTDPLDSDTDNDGISDGWEVENNLNPLTDDASEDLDSDGLTNLEEYYLGTFANNPDSDSDGLTDGDEVNTYSTDPMDSDTDSDGLTDGEEINIYLTDPLDSDTDDDGRFDGWEVEKGKDPLKKDIYIDPIEIGYLVILTSFVILLLMLIYKKRKRVKIKKKMNKVITLKPKLNELYKETFADISSLIIFASSVNEIRNYFEKLKIFLADLLFIQVNNRRLSKNEKERFNKIYEETISFIDTKLQEEMISLVNLINLVNLEKYTKEVSTELIHNWSDKEFKPLIISYEKLISFLELVIAFGEETLTPFNNLISSSDPLWSKVVYLASEKLAIFQDFLRKYNNIFSELANIINDSENDNMRIERLKKISSVYKKISLTKLSPLLGLEDKQVLRLWLYAYSKDVPNRIEGEEVIFDLQLKGVLVTEDMTTAIDDLLKQFSEWERTGKGKKK